jgi:hypothetical protein
MPKRSKKEKPPAIIGFRPAKGDDALLGRLKSHVERMDAEMPGMKHSLSDAMRTLLTRALDEAELASKSKGKVRS